MLKPFLAVAFFGLSVNAGGAQLTCRSSAYPSHPVLTVTFQGPTQILAAYRDDNQSIALECGPLPDPAMIACASRDSQQVALIDQSNPSKISAGFWFGQGANPDLTLPCESD